MTDIFAARLKEARAARSMTQMDLAKASKVPVGSIAHFETSRRTPSFKSFRSLARALDVSADYLLGISDTIAGKQISAEMSKALNTLSKDDMIILEGLLKILTERHISRSSA